MPRHAFLGASLIVLAGVGVAMAEESGIKFDVSGFLDVSAFNDDQDTSGFADPDQDGLGALANGKLQLRGTYLTDGGWEFGARAELRLQSGEQSNSTSGADDWFQAEKLYIWAESGLGRLELGAQDGAAKQAQAAPPSITKSLRIDNPLMMPVADGEGSYYRPAGLMLRSDSYASDQSLKIVYRSPRLFGLQLSLSYTPEFSANLERFVKTAATDFDQQSDIFEAGLNYDTNLDDVRVRASLTYLTANNEAESDTSSTATSPWQSADLSEWSAALNFKMKGLSLGGAFRHSNARGGFVDHAPVVLTGGASDTDIWSFGALYEWESWKIGANYITATTNVAGSTLVSSYVLEQQGDGWQIGAAYQVDTDIQVAAGWQSYRFDAGAGLNPADLAQTGVFGMVRGGYVGSLDADILYTEISFGF